MIESCDKLGVWSHLGLFTLEHFRLDIMTAGVSDVLHQDIIDIKSLLLTLHHLLQVVGQVSLNPDKFKLIIRIN